MWTRGFIFIPGRFFSIKRVNAIRSSIIDCATFAEYFVVDHWMKGLQEYPRLCDAGGFHFWNRLGSLDMTAVVSIEGARLLMSLAAFGLVMGLWVAIILVWRLRQAKKTDKVHERLGLLEDSLDQRTRVLRLWRGATENTIRVPGLVTRGGPLKRLDHLRTEAGWKTPIGLLIPPIFTTAALIFIVLLAMTGHVLAGAAGFIATLLIIWTYLKQCVAKRMEVFDQQFTDALDLAHRSLRAGHPLIGALQLVAEEIGDPVGPVFESICMQQTMGLSLEDAIQAVGNASSNEDMKLFAASLSMQMRSGGNLAHMMERLASVIRDRIRLNRRVRILTAQTQLGKRILVALPFVLLVVLSVLNPKYIDPLFSTGTGQILLCLGGVSVLLGMWMMNRMAVLKY
jgi:tight adherence protein B